MTISSFKDQIPTVTADLNYCFRGADAPLVGSDGLSSRNKSLPVPAAKRSSQSRRRAISWPRSSGGTLHPRSVVRWSLSVIRLIAQTGHGTRCPRNRRQVSENMSTILPVIGFTIKTRPLNLR